MRKRESDGAIHGRGNARSRFKPAILAPLATVLAVAAAIPLAGGSPVHAATGSAEIVVSGTVIASHGKHAAGAMVAIHAWPDQAVIASLKIGQKVPWVLVGTGRTDASGRYSISLPEARLAAEESYGVVNLEADTPSASRFFPVAVTKNAGDSYLPSANVNADLIPSMPGCAGIGWNYVQNLGKHLGTVGETYVLTSHATQHFTYNQGQSSSIEVGVSASGASGSFTAGGTASWSSSFSEDWPTYGANRSVWYQTAFNFGKYSCFIPMAAHTYYMDIVNGYAGGAYIKTPTSIPNTPSRFCVRQAPGSTAKSNNSSAVTWSGSLGIGTGLRFSASIETGYDTSAQVTYHFTAWRHLCGQKGDPGGTPGQLVVHT
jgi:hypothetical protein